VAERSRTGDNAETHQQTGGGGRLQRERPFAKGCVAHPGKSDGLVGLADEDGGLLGKRGGVVVITVEGGDYRVDAGCHGRTDEKAPLASSVADCLMPPTLRETSPAGMSVPSLRWPESVTESSP